MNITRSGEQLLADVVQALSQIPGARTLTISGGAREIYDSQAEEDEERNACKADTYVTYDTFLCIPGDKGAVWLLSLGKEFSGIGQPTGEGTLAVIGLVLEPGVTEELVVAHAVRALVGKDEIPGLLHYTPSGQIWYQDDHTIANKFQRVAETLLGDSYYQPEPKNGAYLYHDDALPLIVDGLKNLFAGKPN